MIITKRVKKLLTKGEAIELSQHCLQKVKSMLLNFCSGCYTKEQILKLREELAVFGLMEFEIVNLIDIKPTGLIHLQLVIEEMAERLDEEKMEKIIEIFSQIESPMNSNVPRD
ncbi:hypothetical protein GINT2_000843 [Glugoides intestinalis]